MKKKESGCPYATALSLSSDDDSSSIASLGESSFSSLQEVCPAFQKKNFSDGNNGTTTTTPNCPFKEAKSADDVKQVLLQLPPSHLQESGHFLKIIQRLHQFVPGNSGGTTNNNDSSDNDGRRNSESSSFSLPGGCPMKEYYGGNTTASAVDGRAITEAFASAMEDRSLSAVMARMAEDMAAKKSEKHDEEQESSELFESNQEEEKQQLQQQKQDDKQEQQQQQRPKKIQLAQALKDGTAVAHQKAEDVDFINDFVHGKIDRNVYPRFVLSLYYIYDAMEECLDAHAKKHFASCHFPKELQRNQSLLEDLEFWFPISTDKDASSSLSSLLPQPSPATQDYIDRLRDVAQTNPLLLLSHAYTRYLGDLSGGKILQRVARKALGLTKDPATNRTEGLAFYEFAEIPLPKKFKDEYRDSLDELDLTDEQRGLLVREANVSFLLNIRIFQEFSSKPVEIMPLREALMVTQRDNNAEETENHAGKTSSDEDASNKCPFMFASEKKNKNPLVAVENHHNTTKKSKNKKNSGGVCPWPFILLHDFRAGMKDFRSWVLIGLLLSFLWSVFLKYS